jgi:hypothetical protein
VTDEPNDIAAKINARRAEAAPERGGLPGGDSTLDKSDTDGIAAWINRLREFRVGVPRANDLSVRRGGRAQSRKRGANCARRIWWIGRAWLA